MKLLLRIALRNVFAHRVKTIIVGSLIFLGIFFIVLGNSFLDSTSRGIQNAYSKSITGQIAVLKRIDFDYSLFGTWADVGNLSVPSLPDYEKTLSYLEGLEDVKRVIHVSSGFAVVNINDTDDGPWMVTLGISPDSYSRMFDVKDTLILHEGRFLEGNEEGIVLSKYIADYLKDYKGIEVHAGDKLLLNGYSTNGFRIREVPIRGIFEFRYVSGDMYPMLPRTCYLDAVTFAVLNGMTVSFGEDTVFELPDELAFSLAAGSVEDLFSDTIETGMVFSTEVVTDLDQILGDMGERERLSKADPNAWQWLLINTKKTDNASVKRMVDLLNDHFMEQFSRFSAEEILEPKVIAMTLVSGRKTWYRHIFSLLSEEQKEHLLSISSGTVLSGEAKSILAEVLTGLLPNKGMYEKEAFDGAYFTGITKNMTLKPRKDHELIRRNRLVLEELFPHSITKGPDLMVSEWWHAAAPMSTTTMGIQLVLNIALIIIFIVSVVIIMNTLIISVMERTGEIGMIRAIGGQKSFISILFITETMTISLIFGVIGIIAGALVLKLMGSAGITAPEGSVLQAMFGSSTIRPDLSLWTVGYSFLFICIIGILSSLYPVHFALKIKPVEAMGEE